MKVVYIADIANDIDDVLAIHYLHTIGMLECVVLDGKSRNLERESKLEYRGVKFKTEIPDNAKILFCGGALTKISEYVKTNKIDVLVANGGFAGNNIVSPENILKKFKNKEKIRTYNFNLDIDATLDVISSPNIGRIILVSKNACHNELNTVKSEIHCDDIYLMLSYSVPEEKLLHDLLMAKEGINFLRGKDMYCDYVNITPVCDRKTPDNMSVWGSVLNENSKISISTFLKPL